LEREHHDGISFSARGSDLLETCPVCDFRLEVRRASGDEALVRGSVSEAFSGAIIEGENGFGKVLFGEGTRVGDSREACARGHLEKSLYLTLVGWHPGDVTPEAGEPSMGWMGFFKVLASQHVSVRATSKRNEVAGSRDERHLG
jgi:hypothetical protein